MPEESSSFPPDAPAPASIKASSRTSAWLPFLNVCASWGNQVISIAGSFIVTPALIHALGDSSYGAWLLINSFIVHLRTLDLGMSAGTLKFSAGALGRGDRARLGQVFTASVVMFAVAASLALLATCGLMVALPRAFPGALAGHHSVVLVLGLAATLDLLMHPQHASLRSRSYYFVPDTAEAATYAAFKFGLVLYLASRGLSLSLLAGLTLAESIVRNVVLSGMGLWLCDWTRRISLKAVDRVTVRALALFGGSSFLINLGEMIRFQLAAAIIAYFISSDHVTVYSIGMRLIHIAYQAIGVIGAMSVPRFSALYESADRVGYRRLLTRTNMATGLMTAYILSNIGVLGLPFLRMWIDKPWVGDAFIVTLIMIPGYFVGLLTGPAAGLLVGGGKLRGLTVMTLAEAGCNFVLSVTLLRWFGIYGVCLGTAIPMVIFRGVIFPFVLARNVEISVGEYYRSHLHGIGLAVVYVALTMPVLLFDIRGPIPFIAAGACTTAVFLALAAVALPDARRRVLARLGLRAR